MTASRSIWESPGSYDAGGESETLRSIGEPFLQKSLERASTLDPLRPRLVDFGCWAGRHLHLLERIASRLAAGSHDASPRIVGIDRPEARDRLAAARTTYTQPHFDIRATGIIHTGLAPSSVDAALSWRVLHNVTKLQELTDALCHIRSVLKHDAPFVVAVRAAEPWMPVNAPHPTLHRTYWIGGEREDLYFSRVACETLFELYGFSVVSTHHFTEDETFNETNLTHPYWLVLLRADHHRRTPCPLAM